MKNILYIPLIIILLYIYIISKSAHDLIGGFWEADDEYCMESGLDMMCLYIDGDYTMTGSRAFYILAQVDNGFIMNDPGTMKINLTWAPSNFFNTSSEKKFSVSMDINYDNFPSYQYANFYPQYNKLVLYYNKTITGIFYKNSKKSEKRPDNDYEDNGNNDIDMDMDEL